MIRGFRLGCGAGGRTRQGPLGRVARWWPGRARGRRASGEAEFGRNDPRARNPRGCDLARLGDGLGWPMAQPPLSCSSPAVALSGQSIGAFDDWLTGSYEIVSGYSESMALSEAGGEWQYWSALVLVGIGFSAAWQGGAGNRRVRIGLAASLGDLGVHLLQGWLRPPRRRSRRHLLRLDGRGPARARPGYRTGA